jgi:hypothetical protein
MKKQFLFSTLMLSCVGLFAQTLHVEGQMRINSDIFVGDGLSLASGAQVSVAAGSNVDVVGGITNNATAPLILERNSSTEYGQLRFTGAYTGTGNVQQSKALSAGWNFLSTPSAVLADAFFGSVGATGTGHTVNTQNLLSWNKTNWSNVANTTTLIPGMGYIGFVGTNGIQTGAGTYTFSGPAVSSVSSSALNFAGSSDEAVLAVNVAANTASRFGWSLLGNPFTCNLDALNITRSNFNTAVYVSNSPTTYQAFTTAGINATIVPPLTAFWMQASGATPNLGGGNITMADHGTFTTANAQRVNFDRLVLRTTLTNDTAKHDYSVLAFIDGTTDGFDGEWDAHKMLNWGGYPNIFSTHTNGDAMAINAIPYGPAYSDKKTVPVSFKAEQQGANFTISYDESYMINSYAVYLEDKLEQTFTDLTAQDYSFMNDTNMVNRFVLHFRAGVLSIDEPENLKNASGITAWVFDNQAYLNAQFNGTAMLSLYDISSKKLQSDRLTLSKGQLTEWPLRADLAAGIYLLRVETATGSQTIKFTK